MAKNKKCFFGSNITTKIPYWLETHLDMSNFKFFETRTINVLNNEIKVIIDNSIPPNLVGFITNESVTWFKIEDEKDG